MDAPSPLASRFARLSTSGKMLIILTLALLPLGLIASLASIETARTNHANRALAAQLLASDSATRMNLYIDRTVTALRTAAGRSTNACRRAADEIDGGAGAASVALFDGNGKLVCASRVFPVTLPLRAAGTAPIVMLDPDASAIRLITSTATGWGIAVLPREALAQASHPNAVDGSYELRLSDSDGSDVALATLRTVTIGRSVVTRLPVANGQLELALTVEATPLSANEVLLILLPLLMWAAASGVGWLVVNRLVLRPLGQLQTAIELSRRNGTALVVPEIATPAYEIRELGAALSGANATIARHEAELEDGLARQTKLTREVHHRVKNNLQVVASLLNIHSRGARTPEAVAAYGSIQRRVEALALVHRSHYAELEVNRGLALRPLIGELVANLRASAPPEISIPAPMLAIGLYHATQDVAVPVAFLITELFELAILRAPGTRLAVSLAAIPDQPDRARLTVASPGLAPEAAPEDEAYLRGLRVVGGLARQLRSTLHSDEATGAVSVDILVMADDAHAGTPASRDAIMQERGGALTPRHIAG